MRGLVSNYRIQLLAAICCLGLCSCRTITQPLADTPIVAAADTDKFVVLYAGDDRYLPDSVSAAAYKSDSVSNAAYYADSPAAYHHDSVSHAIYNQQPAQFPAPVRPVGFTTASDAGMGQTEAPSMPYVSNVTDQDNVTGQPSDQYSPGNVVLGPNSDDSVSTPAYMPGNQILPDDTATHSVDQRDAGPANRWSIYGVDPRYPPMQPPSSFASLPNEAYTGYPGDGYTQPAYVPQYMREPDTAAETVVNDEGLTDPSVLVDGSRVDSDICSDWGQSPLPDKSCGPWKPPGISGPWPEDEYLFDGGDADGAVKVRPDGQLEGLDSEDTVAHFQTIDGHICVKPTNKVCIYAPRFAAIRQVTLAYGDNQLVKAGGVMMPIGPVPQLKVQPVSSAVQPVQPIGEIGQRAPITFLEHTPPVGLIAQTVIRATVDRLKPYEDFDLVRSGLLVEGEKPFIAKSMEAAIAWTDVQGVQVAIEGKKAVVLEGDKRAQATYSIEPPDHPCLRVCKFASTHSAKPGETVEFTIRFDNVGDQTVGNVTIVDNLTTRLELVPGTGQCSKQAQFYAEPNEQGSLILRWEIDDALKPGEGGIARFKCVVR